MITKVMHNKDYMQQNLYIENVHITKFKHNVCIHSKIYMLHFLRTKSLFITFL
jgi:hypothetical protein